MVKSRDKQHHLSIAKKANFTHGMKSKEISGLFYLSKQINYSLHLIIKKRKEKIKLNRNEIDIIVKWERINYNGKKCVC